MGSGEEIRRLLVWGRMGLVGDWGSGGHFVFWFMELVAGCD